MASQEAVDMTEWPVIRPAECPDCPPVDILAQRQHVWIARPTLEAFDQEQSIAPVHHWTIWSHSNRAARSRSSATPSAATSLSMSLLFMRGDGGAGRSSAARRRRLMWRSRNSLLKSELFRL
jgi:hypothetical protein